MAADNEIKVLLTADLAGLQAGMQEATESVTAASEAITAAVEESATAVEAAQAAIGESASAAAEAISASMDEAAAATEAATAKMAESVAAEAVAFNAAVQAKVAAHVRLNAAFAGGVETAAAVAEAESALDEAMGAGAITATEYAGYVERLNAAELEMGEGADVATVAVDANTEAMAINGGVARELGVMLGELARGNTARLEGSFITLGNRTGFLSTVLSALSSPLGMVGVGAAAAGYAIFDSSEAFGRMEGAVLATGMASGETAGQLMDMANEIGQTTTTIYDARDAVLSLAQSGKFVGDDLHQAAEAAVDMAELTGQSVEQAAATIEKLRADPLKAVVALNDQFHFLTVAEYEHMQQLVATGDQAGATKVAFDAFSQAMLERTNELNEHANVLLNTWHALRNEFATSMEEANVALGGGDTGEKLAVAKQRLSELTSEAQRLHAVAQAMHVSGFAGDIVEHNADVERKEVARLQAQLDAETAKNKPAAAAAQSSAETIDGIAKKGKKGDSQEDRDEYNELKLQHDLSLADERNYWEQKKDAATKGTQEYRQAVQQLVEIKDREVEAGKAAARQEAAEAKKSAAEQLNSMEMVRAGTEANTTERIQADAAVLESATKLYGANSSQQKAALASMLADEKSFDASVLKERQQAAQEEAQISITAAQGAADIKRQQIETAFSLGEISRQKEIAAIAAANEAEYQLEMQAFAKELALLDAKSKAAGEVEKQIASLQKQYALEAQKSSGDQQKAMQQSWQKALKPIDSAFQQSIQGMIQGTQSFKKGLDNILLSIVASYAQMGISTLMNWIANEGAKTAATTVGTEQRAVVEQTAAAQSKATDAATGKSQITSAAATGAAKAYQAIVGIPYVGPILAPIAAGVAFAGIEAFSGSLASARGGWERVPIDGSMTELHKDEMVLPAHIANPMRQMAKQGGQGGGHQVHVHTTDPRSFKDYMRRNPAAIASAIKLAGRRGHMLGAR